VLNRRFLLYIFPVISHWQSLVSYIYIAIVIPKYVVQWLRLALSKRPNIVGVSHCSPEDGNRFCFRNVLFFCVL
jgi:hypothetical protein